MSYSRESHERVQEELSNAKQKESDQAKEWSEASEIDKIPLTTYQSAINALDYLRGRTDKQIRGKLDRSYDQAHEEALGLEKQHVALEAEVETLLSQFKESVDRLRRFESEMLKKEQ